MPIRRLQFGHGGEAVENLIDARKVAREGHRFNSATAVRPWKTMPKCRTCRLNGVLQFGHGGEAVENKKTSSAG